MILQPYDMEMGAGTFHTATFLRSIGPEPWSAAYVQPSRRPTDGRYGDNPFRLQHYYQFQVVIKPSPLPILDLYLGSLRALGFDTLVHDIRFVEDNWESPTLGAWGLGWEVWLNGMEVTQFTYFQQVGGLDCKPVTGEITYGLERLAMYLQGVESIFDIVWTDGPLGRVTYRDVFHQNEVEQSAYNFEHADTAVLLRHFDDHEAACGKLLEAKLALPAYEQVMKASHTFNLLDARKAISVTERQRYILRVRTLARAVAQAYYDSREALGFPMLKAHARGCRHDRDRPRFSRGAGHRRAAAARAAGTRTRFCRRHSRRPLRSGPATWRASFVRDASAARRLGPRSRRHAAGPGHQAQGPAGECRVRQGRQAHRGRDEVRREVRRGRRCAHAHHRGQRRVPVFRGLEAGPRDGRAVAGHRAALARPASHPETHALGLHRARSSFAPCIGW